jgi:NTP pyrophosphatase (non-canonical NTP hydrolase)
VDVTGGNDMGASKFNAQFNGPVSGFVQGDHSMVQAEFGLSEEPGVGPLEALMGTQLVVLSIRAGRPPAGQVHTYVTALLVEAGELMNELNWKPWKARRALDPARVLDEYADVVAFTLLVGAMLADLLGVTLGDVEAAYAKKLEVVAVRQAGGAPGYEKEVGSEQGPSSGG